jgi:glutamate mutase epsilon subunit
MGHGKMRWIGGKFPPHEQSQIYDKYVNAGAVKKFENHQRNLARIPDEAQKISTALTPANKNANANGVK